MLPDIQAEDRGAEIGVIDDAFHERVVLVGGGGDLEFAVLGDDEPGPAGAEALHTGLAEEFFEVVDAGEGALDGVAELAFGTGGTAASGGHPFPEPGVVHMAAAVVADGGLGGCGERFDVGDQFDGVGLADASGLECIAQLGDVGGVVLAKMDVHGQGINVRFQGFGSVRQGSLGEVQRVAAGGYKEGACEGGGAGGEEGATVHGGRWWFQSKHTKAAYAKSRRKCCVQSFVAVVASQLSWPQSPIPPNGLLRSPLFVPATIGA